MRRTVENTFRNRKQDYVIDLTAPASVICLVPLTAAVIFIYRGAEGRKEAASYFWERRPTAPLEVYHNRVRRNGITCMSENYHFAFHSRCTLEFGVFWRKNGGGRVSRCFGTRGKLNLHFSRARTWRGFCTKQAKITPSPARALRLNLESLDEF